MTDLILLAGIPGSGKSTYADTFFRWKGYSIVSSDEIRRRHVGSVQGAFDEGYKPWDEFYTRIDDQLRMGVSTIADATFLTTRHRDRARDIARARGADLHIVMFKNIWDAWERNKTRPEADRLEYQVVDGMVTLYWDTLAQLPQEWYTTKTMIESFT